MNETDEETHYSILGVPQNATPEMIKRAYISLVKQYHPDKVGSDKEKQEEYNERLLKIMSSYEILADPNKRAEYDQELNHEGDATEYNVSRGKKMCGMPKKGGDIESDYPISMAIAAYGKGKLPMKVAGEHVVVKVYPGVRRYRVEGYGIPVEPGKPRGDLYINLKVIPEEDWEIDEKTNDLIHTVQLTPKQALQGGTIEIQLLINRELKITIPPNLKAGDIVRPPEGKGLGIRSPKLKGDLVIKVQIAEKKGFLSGLFKR